MRYGETKIKASREDLSPIAQDIELDVSPNKHIRHHKGEASNWSGKENRTQRKTCQTQNGTEEQ